MKTRTLEDIIAGLNKRPDVAHMFQDNLAGLNLTEKERKLIETYKPENACIIYGSLAPGKPNHYVVEPIPGEWQQGIVRGMLESIGWGAALGYLAFQHCPPEEQQEIPASILISKELKSNWPRLDEFEEEEYRRILAPYELENGEVGVGYIYAANQANV